MIEGRDILGAVAASLTSDAIAVLDAESRHFVDVNIAFTQLFGYSRQEACSLSINDFILSEPLSQSAVLPELVAKRHIDVGVRSYRAKDGSVIRCATRGNLVDVEGVSYYVGVLRNVSELELAEQALADSEARLRTLVEASFEGIAITEEGLVVDCNEQLVRLLGRPRHEIVGQPGVRFVPPEWVERIVERMHRGIEGPFEHALIRGDGTEVMVETQAKTVEVGGRSFRVSSIRDITTRVKMEAQLRRSQRLESVGRLAGGIAHDFNNLLTVVLSISDLMLERSPDASVEDDLRQIQTAAAKASELTQQLLAFARRRIVEPRVVSLGVLVTDLEKLLRRLVGEQVTLVTVCTDGLGAVRVDPGQIEQVVVNLAINARDAMVGGGTLTIETTNTSLGEEYAAAHPEVTPGEYVMLAVSDTGSGMDAETLEHIFEPFFTTKSERGHGLGLATCYGIIKQNGGSLFVYSEPGKGSTFKIYLPRVYEQADVLAPQAKRRIRSGTETLLLVEDDPMVRRVAARALRDYGYSVHEAAAPSEACAAFERLLGKVDALVTDVVMPEMTGRELAKRLRRERPDLKVLYTSGYTENTIVHQGVVDQGIHFLAKPYVPAELARHVRDLLDESSI